MLRVCSHACGGVRSAGTSKFESGADFFLWPLCLVISHFTHRLQHATAREDVANTRFSFVLLARSSSIAVRARSSGFAVRVAPLAHDGGCAACLLPGRGMLRADLLHTMHSLPSHDVHGAYTGPISQVFSCRFLWSEFEHGEHQRRRRCGGRR